MKALQIQGFFKDYIPHHRWHHSNLPPLIITILTNLLITFQCRLYFQGHFKTAPPLKFKDFSRTTYLIIVGIIQIFLLFFIIIILSFSSLFNADYIFKDFSRKTSKFKDFSRTTYLIIVGIIQIFLLFLIIIIFTLLCWRGMTIITGEKTEA